MGNCNCKTPRTNSLNVSDDNSIIENIDNIIDKVIDEVKHNINDGIEMITQTEKSIIESINPVTYIKTNIYNNTIDLCAYSICTIPIAIGGITLIKNTVEKCNRNGNNNNKLILLLTKNMFPVVTLGIITGVIISLKILNRKKQRGC